MKMLFRLAVLTLAMGAVWLGCEAWQASRGRTSAIQLLARSEWTLAQARLTRYLRLFPNDSGARMLLAEAYDLDESMAGGEGARQAIAQLQRVPDPAPQSSAARAKEGALRFLRLSQPVAGERALRKAIDLDPQNFEAHFMLWKLLGLTGRAHLGEKVFWNAYELSQPDARLTLLREWFLAEFHPESTTAPLDRHMGFLGETEMAGVLVESRRLNQFWLTEPDSPIMGCAIARLYLGDGMYREAREVLAKTRISTSVVDDPFVAATQLNVLYAFGEFEKARACLERWPAPQTDFEYWKWKAILLDESGRDDRGACAAYDHAISIWPGNADAKLLHRKSRCLERLGKHAEAESVRERSDRINKLLEPAFQKRLRKSLGHLDNPAEFEAIVDFYRQIERTREFLAWSQLRPHPPDRTSASRRPTQGANSADALVRRQ
jgi:tetratricopeptide (TPR) repeat protein